MDMVGRVLGAVIAVAVPVVALWFEPVRPWWVAAVIVAFFAVPSLLWVALARGRFTVWVALLVLPGLMFVTFAFSTMLPDRVRPPAWDFLVAFGVLGTVASLLLLLADRQRSRVPVTMPYRLGVGLLVFALLATAGVAVNKHEELGRLAARPTSADVPAFPEGYRVLQTRSDCADFCGGLIALGSDRPVATQRTDLERAFLDAGWQTGTSSASHLEFTKAAGGFLGWHEASATVRFAEDPALFPGIDEDEIILIAIARWVPMPQQ